VDAPAKQYSAIDPVPDATIIALRDVMDWDLIPEIASSGLSSSRPAAALF
jgi:hypothetical protein